jgi:hypothetical protein
MQTHSDSGKKCAVGECYNKLLPNSAFPFKVGDELVARIEGEKVAIEKKKGNQKILRAYFFLEALLIPRSSHKPSAFSEL